MKLSHRKQANHVTKSCNTNLTRTVHNNLLDKQLKSVKFFITLTSLKMSALGFGYYVNVWRNSFWKPVYQSFKLSEVSAIINKQLGQHTSNQKGNVLMIILKIKCTLKWKLKKKYLCIFSAVFVSLHAELSTWQHVVAA